MLYTRITSKSLSEHKIVFNCTIIDGSSRANELNKERKSQNTAEKSDDRRLKISQKYSKSKCDNELNI